MQVYIFTYYCLWFFLIVYVILIFAEVLTFLCFNTKICCKTKSNCYLLFIVALIPSFISAIVVIVVNKDKLSEANVISEEVLYLRNLIHYNCFEQQVQKAFASKIT